jgi:ubiquinone biosynthesis protein
MAGRLDDHLRDEFEELLLAIVAEDSEPLTDIIVRLGSVPRGFDRDRLRADLAEFVADYSTQSIQDFDMSGALERVTGIVREHHIVLPTSCTMLIKTLVVLEGTAQMLSPGFNLGQVMAPYQAEIVKRRYSPQRLLRRARRTYRDWDRLLAALPRQLSDILRGVQQGSFDVNLQHRRLDSVVNRLVLGLISSALFVGSALLWALEAPPLLAGVPVFGVLGCVLAAFLGYRLLRAIPRSGSIAPRD